MAQCNCGQTHVTLEKFKTLSPFEQGYVTYWQGAHPGSELKKHQSNPYQKSTPEWEQFQNGQQAAVIAAQDSEE